MISCINNILQEKTRNLLFYYKKYVKQINHVVYEEWKIRITIVIWYNR